jgi:hypothetical protein
MSNHIAIFYHIFQRNHWKELFERQLITLQQSGLYDAADYIHFGINGDEPLPFELIKVNSIKRNTNWDSEADTLADLHAFAEKHEEYRIIYIHTKTASIPPDYSCWENVNLWLDYLEYFNVKNWRACVDLLDKYDCVGTDWHTDAKLPHYSGNFWWANADYIAKLETDFLYAKCDLCDTESRHRSEYWISTKNPAFYSFYSSNLNKYLNPILPEQYKHIEIKSSSNNLIPNYPSWHGKFRILWDMVGQSITEVYGKDEEPNTVLSIGIQNHDAIANVRSSFNSNKVIMYQHEPLVEQHWIKPDVILEHQKGSDDVWDYDLQNVHFLRENGIDVKFRPPLYTRSLKRVKNSDNPDIDLLFYGTFTPYRCKILSDFTTNCIIPYEDYDRFLNMSVMVLWNVHGIELDEYIGRSKIILNLNPYEGQCRQQQIRIFYNLINNKCVLSDKSTLNYYGDMIVEFSGAQEMVYKLCYLLRDDNWRKYTKNNFRSQSRRILREGEKVFENQLRSLQQQ